MNAPSRSGLTPYSCPSSCISKREKLRGPTVPFFLLHSPFCSSSSSSSFLLFYCSLFLLPSSSFALLSCTENECPRFEIRVSPLVLIFARQQKPPMCLALFLANCSSRSMTAG